MGLCHRPQREDGVAVWLHEGRLSALVGAVLTSKPRAFLEVLKL